MATRNEISRKIRIVNNQISYQQRVIEDYAEQIECLRAAKTRLEEEKAEIKTLQNQLKLRNCAGYVQWRGKSKSDFDQMVNVEVKEAGNAFKNQVSDMISTIYWKIRDLESKKTWADIALTGLYRKKRSLQLQYALARD